jgi:hypothetical protein
MTWLEGFEENWTNAVHMTAARLERRLNDGAPLNADTVRKVLESVNAQWRDPDHFYGVWFRDFRAAHPEAGRQFDAILIEMANRDTPSYEVRSPMLPVTGGVVIGAAAFGVLTATGAGMTTRVITAVAVGVATAAAWWTTAKGSRRESRDQGVAQVTRELARYGDRLRKLVTEADGIDSAAAH